MKKFVKILVILLCVCLSLVACSKSQQTTTTAKPGDTSTTGDTQKETVKVGLFTALSGSNAASGAYDMKGASFAIKQINESGGVLGGRQLELVPIDSTSDSNQSALILERELSSRKLSAIVGSSSSNIVLTQLPVLEKYKVPAITAGVNADITAKGYKYIFRAACVGHMISTQNIDFMKYLIEISGKKPEDYKVGIVYENSAYGKDTSAGYEKTCEAANLKVLVNETYPAGAFTDASPIVTKLKNAGVDLVLTVSFAQDAKLILNTMRSMEYAPIVLGGGNAYIWPTLFEAIGEDVNGIISSSGWSYDSQNNNQMSDWDSIVKAYEAEYNEFLCERAGGTYVFFRILADAIDRAGSDDSAKVRDALSESTSENSEWMKLIQPGKDNSFDETGQITPVSPIVVQWQDNIPRTIYPLELASSPVRDIDGNPIN